MLIVFLGQTVPFFGQQANIGERFIFGKREEDCPDMTIRIFSARKICGLSSSYVFPNAPMWDNRRS